MAAFPPSTIRAWQYSATKGGLENNLKLNASAPLPKPSSKQHLVQVITVALNPVDYKLSEIPLLHRFLLHKPATPGIDYAGSIVTPATGSSLKSGQLVFGAASKSIMAGGALSDFAVSDIANTIALIDGIDPTIAASIPVAGLTAYQSIVPYVKEGDHIFINGGSGGTGNFCIQIAKALGCHVTTTCSTTNVDLCKSLGADEVVDYKNSSVINTLKASEHKFDHVVDNVGADPDLYWQCHQYTTPKAEFIMVGATISFQAFFNTLKMKQLPSCLGGGKRKFNTFFLSPNAEQLEQIVTWIKEGKIKPVIDQIFPFEQAPEAFTKLKTGRAKGKIVVDVASKTYKKTEAS